MNVKIFKVFGIVLAAILGFGIGPLMKDWKIYQILLVATSMGFMLGFGLEKISNWFEK